MPPHLRCTHRLTGLPLLSGWGCCCHGGNHIRQHSLHFERRFMCIRMMSRLTADVSGQRDATTWRQMGGGDAFTPHYLALGPIPVLSQWMSRVTAVSKLLATKTYSCLQSCGTCIRGVGRRC